MLRDLDSTNGTYVNGTRIKGQVEIQAGDLIQFADVAMRLRLQGARQDSCTLAEDVYDQALALVQLDKLLSERAVTPYYQPIIELKTRRVIGQEVLGRSRLLGIESPLAMFRAASKMNLEVPLSQMLRWEGIRQAERFATPQHLFVNTHPAELTDSSFVPSLVSLRDAYPDVTLTLEIHEGAVTEIPAMQELRVVLNDLDISLAYDDFGAGQARLLELVEIKPDYLKFDISLVRNLDQASSAHQQLVESLVRIARDLEVAPLAEGVETAGQSEICEQIGFELGQGFYYGRPAPIDCDI